MNTATFFPRKASMPTKTVLVQIHPGDERAAIQALTNAGIWCQIGNLSPREKEVVAFVGCGMTNVEIGERMNISNKTVSALLGRARIKTGARNRTEVALYSARAGLTSERVAL